MIALAVANEIAAGSFEMFADVPMKAGQKSGVGESARVRSQLDHYAAVKIDMVEFDQVLDNGGQFRQQRFRTLGLSMKTGQAQRAHPHQSALRR